MNLNIVMSTGDSSTAPGRQRHVKNRHPLQEWEQRKELIKRLFLDEGITVKDTMRYLKDEEGFIVGERKFRMQLKEWGFEKNIRSSVMQRILAKATKRKFEEDKSTRFRYKGRDILPERLGHSAKRSHVKNSNRLPLPGSHREIECFTEELEICQSEACYMSKNVIHGCKSCKQHVADAVEQPFHKLRSFCIRFSYDDALGATEEFSRTISPLCNTCRVIAYEYMLSVRKEVAKYHFNTERYLEATSGSEKIIQTCMELGLSGCSHIVSNSVSRLSRLYAYQGLLHEVEQKLPCSGHDGEDSKSLTWFGNHLMLAKIYKLQQRPEDVLRGNGILSTFCIERFGLHSGMMHAIVLACAQASYELGDYRTSTDLYQRLLAEDMPKGDFLANRTLSTLVGLSNICRSIGSFHSAKKYAYHAIEVAQVHGSAPTRQLSCKLQAPLVQCYLNLAVSFDNEDKSVEAESYFSRVVVGCEYLNRKRVSLTAVSVVSDLRRHYFDKPRRIDAHGAKVDGNHLVHLANTLSGNPLALQCLLVAIIRQADSFSRSHQFEEAEYLFNQARGLLDPNNLRFQYFFALQIGQHHRRQGEWKFGMQCLEKAVALSEQQHGPDHACTISFKERLTAYRGQMEKTGISASAITQSLSLRTISSAKTNDTSSDDTDRLDFLEDGVWGLSPASLMDFA